MNDETDIKENTAEPEMIIEIPVIEETAAEMITEIPLQPIEGELLNEVPAEEQPKKRGPGRPKKVKTGEPAEAKVTEDAPLLTPKHIKLIKGNLSKRTALARYGIKL